MFTPPSIQVRVVKRVFVRGLAGLRQCLGCLSLIWPENVSINALVRWRSWTIWQVCREVESCATQEVLPSLSLITSPY